MTTRFAGNANRVQSHQPLTNDQLYRYAPSIFATEPHESRSERYTYIPTINVLDGLRNQGFEPFFATQSRSRIEGKSEFTKHMLRLRQVSDIERKAVVGETVNEIVMVNSHDGTSSYQLIAGVFRFVCSNGMMVSDGTIENIRVQHKGNIVDDVIGSAFRLMGQFGRVDESIDMMRSLALVDGEREVFAKAALALKYEEGKEPINEYQLLRPVRSEDRGNSLWNTFNVVQEHLLDGGVRGRSATSGRTQTTRPVTGIDQSVGLNRALWVLADKMAELKGVRSAS